MLLGEITRVSDKGRRMSIHRQTACWIITALAHGTAPVPADAQTRPDQEVHATLVDSTRPRTGLGHAWSIKTGPGFKSGTTALMWSLLGTIVPVGAGVLGASMAAEGSSDPTPGLLFLGGMLVGPALGHFYAGRPGRALAGIGVRTVSLAGLLGGFAASWNNNSGGDALFLAGLVLSATAVAWDIAKAPHSAEVHNRTIQPGRVTIAFSPLHNAAGVRIGARLSF